MLILVRHGQSWSNLENRFAGSSDPDLTDIGVEEAIGAGRKLNAAGLTFRAAYSSALVRAQHTLRLILQAMGESALTPIYDAALNERDYGELTGLNKDDARARWGRELVQVWRRSVDFAPPGGESFRRVAARVDSFLKNEILPGLSAGRNTIIVAHGSSLRAAMMTLERLTPKDALKRELETGAPRGYFLDERLRITGRLEL